MILSAFSPSGVKMSCFSSLHAGQERAAGRRCRERGRRRHELRSGSIRGLPGGVCDSCLARLVVLELPSPVGGGDDAGTDGEDRSDHQHDRRWRPWQLGPVGDEERRRRARWPRRGWRRPTSGCGRRTSGRPARTRPRARGRRAAPATGISIGHMSRLRIWRFSSRRRRWPARTTPRTIHSRPTSSAPRAPITNRTGDATSPTRGEHDRTGRRATGSTTRRPGRPPAGRRRGRATRPGASGSASRRIEVAVPRRRATGRVVDQHRVAGELADTAGHAEEA